MLLVPRDARSPYCSSSSSINGFMLICHMHLPPAPGWAGDWLINSGRCSVAAGRKVINTAGFWSAAAALMLMPGAQHKALGFQ